MSTRAFLAVVLTLTLVSSAVAAPTTQQIIKELNELQGKLSKRFQFIIMNQAVGQIIKRGATVPGDIDWSPFFYNTVLIPTDFALKQSGLLNEPKTPEDAINLMKSISYNVVKGMYPFSKIKKLPIGSSIPLLLNNGKLFRRKKVSGFAMFKTTEVALALKGKPKGNWSTIVGKNLHRGSSFICIGVRQAGMEEDDRSIAAPEGKNKAIDYDKLERDVDQQRDVALKEGRLTEALDALLGLEKQMRLAADVVGTRTVAVAILKVCHEAAAWKLLNEQIVALSKRRAQLKQVVAAMVQEAMKYVDDAPDDVIREELIKTLSGVTAGKIYVEIERARLVKRLARMKEAEGKVKEAAEIMQEVAVETFGAMAKTEKIDFILEQVRLCLDSDDFMRAQILAKKISPRAFASETVEAAEKAKAAEAAAAAGGGEGKEEGKKKRKGPKEEGEIQPAAPDVPTLVELKLKFYELMIREKRKGQKEEGRIQLATPDVPTLVELKLMFYELMIRYHTNANDYLEICRCYQNIYDTPAVKADQERWIPVLKRICWYLVLAPHGSMQSSLLHSTFADPHLLDLPKFRALLKLFITMEVVGWPQLQADYSAEMQEEKPTVFLKDSALEDLRLRVIQHNILVMSKYYVRITMARLAQLLSLTVEEAEKFLSDMVVEKVLVAKIDRPAGIVTFGERQESGVQLLDKWASDIAKLLDLVETSCHHIHKEVMVHKVVLKT
ncbi:unnamed protein product [Closterium sp. NIES-54]